jgi:hypothetical protein
LQLPGGKLSTQALRRDLASGKAVTNADFAFAALGTLGHIFSQFDPMPSTAEPLDLSDGGVREQNHIAVGETVEMRVGATDIERNRAEQPVELVDPTDDARFENVAGLAVAFGSLVVTLDHHTLPVEGDSARPLSASPWLESSGRVRSA